MVAAAALSPGLGYSENQGTPRKEKKSRSNCPGIRVVGGRIYDSTNGKTCHQCRQKTMDFMAPCRNMKGDKQCTIGFCHKCLTNRYGEKAEEVAQMDDWKCPKCRGICNCSFCMKKRGQKPTGILVHVAKENGFSSVSELLRIRDADNVDHDEIAKDKGSSLKKPISPKKEPIARKLGKENSFDGKSDLSLHSPNSTSFANEKKSKKMKSEGLKELSNSNMDDDVTLGDNNWEKPGIAEEISETEMKIDRNDKCVIVKKKKSKTQSRGATKQEGSVSESNEIIVGKKRSKAESKSEEELKTNGKDDDIFVGKRKSNLQALEVSSREVKVNEKADSCVEKGKYKKQVKDKHVKGLKRRADPKCKNGGLSNSVKDDNLETTTKTAIESCKINSCTTMLQNKKIDADVLLPSGTSLTTVAGIEYSPDDVGHALQFLEFCAAFGKVLNLKKGQAEAIIREIMNNRRVRRTVCRSQNYLEVQIYIQLLSLIRKDIGEKPPAQCPMKGQDSWLEALGKCVSECQFMSKDFPSDCFNKHNEGYDKLSISEKLRLLNFLCDEALDTQDLRNWIDDQNSKFLEREKEAREKVVAAKNKEKHLKHKIKDEVAKAIIAKNGLPLSISEHESIVSQIKIKATQAHAEMLEAMGMIPKKKLRSDAVRTDPIFVDDDGHAFWKLNSYNGQQDILLQDLDTKDSVETKEKWFFYNTEQNLEVEKYISSSRKKRLRCQEVTDDGNVYRLWSQDNITQP